VANLYLIAAIVAAAVAVGATSGWKLRDMAADAELSQVRAEHAAAAADAERASRVESEALRERERVLRNVTAKEVEDARQDAALDARRAADLRTVSDRLRGHVARLAAATAAPGGDPATAAGGETAAGPGLVLADLYGRADDEARELAASYDAARRAGLTCERLYDAARGPT